MHIVKVKRLKVYGIIYYIKNKENGKYYVGQTIQGFDKRYPYDGKHGIPIEKVYKTLKADKKRGKSVCKKLLKDIKKYGFDAFKVNKEVDIAFNREELDEKEQFYIKKYDSVNHGYNTSGGGQKKRKLSLEEKEITSKGNKKFYKKMKKLAEKGDEKAIEFLNNQKKHLEDINNKTREYCKMIKEMEETGNTDNEIYQEELRRRKRNSEGRKNKIKELKRLAFEENNKLALEALKRIIPQSKPVRCITTGKTFFSSADAGRYYDLDRRSVLRACKGKQKSCGGFTWEFIN